MNDLIGFSIFLILAFFSWRQQGFENAPCMDADETFNYVEPLHYNLHYSGLQTWEYSPTFGLRSWFYIEIHSILLKIVQLILSVLFSIELDKVAQLFTVRLILYSISLIGEYALIRTFSKVLEEKKQTRFKLLSLVIFASSAGMAHSRRSILPSSSCMILLTYSFSEWIKASEEKHKRFVTFLPGLLLGSVAVLIVWPFCALLFVPMGLHALASVGLAKTSLIGMICLFVCGLFPSFIDSYFFYKRVISPTFQMITYNALGQSGGGAHLYGVEPWTYYFKNLFLNFNVALLLVPLACVYFAWGKSRPFFLFLASPLLLNLCLFQAMAHKEERFLAPSYPLICLSLSLFLTELTDARGNKLAQAAAWIALGLFVLLSGARSESLSRLAAPSLVFLEAKIPSEKTVCVGREWHKFPSSFYLSEGSAIRFTKSAFSGLLPQPFLPHPFGYFSIPKGMNDLNKHDESKYLKDVSQCDFYMDHTQSIVPGVDQIDHLNTKLWKPRACAAFMDQNASQQPFRSFSSMYDKWYGVKKIQYCIYERV